MTSNKIALLSFHLAMTDSMNCLALINYYSTSYDKIYLLINPSVGPFVKFYIRNMQNIEPINEYDSKYLDDPNCDLLLHGYDDHMRRDKYNRVFYQPRSICFVRAFYELYDIPYIIQVDCFDISRDLELENNVYNNFVNSNLLNESNESNESKYILYHGIDSVEINNPNNIFLFKLDYTTNILFDMIKVLENATELHLLDSVWGALCYLLDCKYNLFKNKNIPVYLYAKRGYEAMFSEPIKMDNWVIISNNT